MIQSWCWGGKADAPDRVPHKLHTVFFPTPDGTGPGIVFCSVRGDDGGSDFTPEKFEGEHCITCEIYAKSVYSSIHRVLQIK